MSIQTVTTILTEPGCGAAQLEAAVGFARAMDAHLHVLALAFGMDQVGVGISALDAVPVGAGLEDCMAQAKALGELASDHLSNEDIRWHVDTLSAPMVGSRAMIAHHTRFSDLVLRPTRQGDTQTDTTRMLAETVLFDADSPLLLLPPEAMFTTRPQAVLVSWDESAAALRAARQALPLLTSTSRVHVVLVDPPKDGLNRSDPGGAFAQFLSRHGAKCEVSVCNQVDNSVSATLERRAQELGCEMIVMGAYGHSRLRQAIFGGTTRDMLDKTSFPVFMSH